jgi:hypothetical protein
MDAVLRTIALLAFGVSLVVGPIVPNASATCLPGQTCWQPPQLQNSQPPAVRDDTLQQQLLRDRTTVQQNQQQLTTDRTKLRMPLGTLTPLDKTQQRQQVRTDREQLLQSQQSLQRSQQLLLDQQRPPSPTPYVIKPLGARP